MRGDDNSEDEDTLEHQPEPTPVTLADVQDCLFPMREFAFQWGLYSVLSNIMDIDTDLASIATTSHSTYSKISDFFE